MCMKRDPEDCDQPLYPFPSFDFIDLTMDELGGNVRPMDDGSSPNDDEDEDDDHDVLPISARPLRFPYNLLPSMHLFDEIPGRLTFADFLDDEDYDIPTPDEYTTTNTDSNITRAASVNVNVNIAETSGTDQPNEGREFELNIPQILLSMSTVSNNLFGSPTTSNN